MSLDMQLELFGIAFDELGPAGDLVNQCLEVIAEEAGTVRILRYRLPHGDVPISPGK